MPRLTQVPASSLDRFRLRGCHALWPLFPKGSANDQIGNSTVAGPTTPPVPNTQPSQFARLNYYCSGPHRSASISCFAACWLECLLGTEGLGCSDFARHYYRNRGFFLLLEVLRWFTSLRSPVPTYEFSGTYLGFA